MSDMPNTQLPQQPLPYMQPYYNPYTMRLQQMEQAYPHLVQQNPYLQQNPQSNVQQNAQNQQIVLKGKPVSGIDEARATQIDFDGSLHVFTDMGNNKIYTKQLATNGIVTFKIYAEQTETNMAPVVKEPESSISDDVRVYLEKYTTDVNKKIADLEAKIKEYETNVQSNATNRNASRQRKSNDASSTASGE